MSINNSLSKGDTVSASDVRKLASLAHLTLSDEEVSSLASQMNTILGYVKSLDAYDIEGVEPLSHVHGVVNVFRSDTKEPHMPSEDGLKNAPDVSGTFIRVPLIVEQV